MSTCANYLPSSARDRLQEPHVGALPPGLPVVLAQQFQAVAASTFDQLLKSGAQIIVSHCRCLDLWVAKKDQQGNFTSLTSLVNSTSVVQTVLADQLTHVCAAIERTGSVHSEQVELNSPRILAGAPIRLRQTREPVELVLVGCYDLQSPDDFDPIWLTILAAEHASQWVQNRTWLRLDREKQQLDDLLKCCTQLAMSDNQTQAARVLVNFLRRQTGLQHVSLVVDDELLAVSDLEQFDPRGESSQVVKAACCSSLEGGSSISYHAASTATDPRQLPLQTFCRSNQFESCVSVPLFANDKSTNIKACLLFAGSAERFQVEGYLDQLEATTFALSPQLRLALQAHRTVAKIGSDWLSRMIRHRWRKVAMVATAALVLLLALPLPYRISCDCEIQPVAKRFIVAPFESVLERSFVKNGDVVSRNQVLAQLDGRQLRIELSGLQAELAGAKKRYDSELAAGNIAQSQIAKSESDRLKAKINLLNERTQQLEIRSPIEGVVVIGDLDKAEGASLQLGQALFEIAPLDQMHVEVAIPEPEIQYVQSQMPVSVKLNAFPFATWDAEIQSIHPSAEIIDNQNVFVAQALVGNEDGSLRPGMKGKAKVRSNWAPLGWSLFHRPWETIRYWTVW